MNREPDIVITGRFRGNEPRELYLWEYNSEDRIIFSYRFGDWDDKNGYFILHDDIIYFNRDYPILDIHNEVSNEYREYAYSNSEIRNAIQNYLVEKLILMEC